MNEKFLIYSLIFLVLVIFILIPFGKKILKKLPLFGSHENQEKFPISLKSISENTEVKARLMVSLGLMTLVYLLGWVPIPFIDWNALAPFIANSASLASVKTSVSTLGILPFFMACISIQLLSVLIPPLRRWMFGEEKGREKLSFLTYILTLLFALGSSYWIAKAIVVNMPLTISNHTLGIALIALSFTGSVALLIGIAKLIEHYGLGNGFALVFVTPLLADLIFSIKNLWTLQDSGELIRFILCLFVWGILLVLIYQLTQRGYSISFSKPGKEKAVIPLRISMMGIKPIGWTSSIILLPATLAQFWDKPFLEQINLVLLGWLKWPTMVFLIILFCWIYSRIVFSPDYLARMASRLGFEAELEEKANLQKYLRHSLWRTVRITAILFILLITIGEFLFFKLHISSGTIFTSNIIMLILVGIFYDLLSQAAFYKERENSGRKDWRIFKIALGEMEAIFHATSLRERGVPALIEPIRFTWGMPIRTIVDQYRIYCPEEYLEDETSITFEK